MARYTTDSRCQRVDPCDRVVVEMAPVCIFLVIKGAALRESNRKQRQKQVAVPEMHLT